MRNLGGRGGFSTAVGEGSSDNREPAGGGLLQGRLVSEVDVEGGFELGDFGFELVDAGGEAGEAGAEVVEAFSGHGHQSFLDAVDLQVQTADFLLDDGVKHRGLCAERRLELFFREFHTPRVASRLGRSMWIMGVAFDSIRHSLAATWSAEIEILTTNRDRIPIRVCLV